MAYQFSLEEIAFRLQELENTKESNQASIFLRTVASGNDPLYVVSATLKDDNSTFQSYVRYDAGKKIFIDQPDGLQIMGLSNEVVGSIMDKMSSVYSQLVNLGYVRLEESAHPR